MIYLNLHFRLIIVFILFTKLGKIKVLNFLGKTGAIWGKLNKGSRDF